MKIRISPTRMALLRLRKRLIVARRGHKLLKDKLDGLLQAFMPIVEEYGRLRTRIDRELPGALNLFTLAGATAGSEAVEAALDEYETVVDMSIEKKIVMSVPLSALDLRGFEIRIPTARWRPMSISTARAIPSGTSSPCSCSSPTSRKWWCA